MTEQTQHQSTPLDEARAAMAFHPRDWAADHRDAWVWGIVVGWGDEGLGEVAAKHGWSAEKVARLRALHAEMEAAHGKR